MPENPPLWIHDGTILGMTLPGASLTWYTWKQTADSSPPVSKSYYETRSVKFHTSLLNLRHFLLPFFCLPKSSLNHGSIEGKPPIFKCGGGKASQILSDKPLKPHRWFLLRNSPFFHSLIWALRLLLWQQPVLLGKRAEFEILGSQLSHWSENSLGMSWSFQLPDLISFGPYKVDEKTETEIPGLKLQDFWKFFTLTLPWGQMIPFWRGAYVSNGLVEATT